MRHLFSLFTIVLSFSFAAAGEPQALRGLNLPSQISASPFDAGFCRDLHGVLSHELELSFFNKRRDYPDYFAGYCSGNIQKLSIRLRDAGVDLSRAEVWYIFRRDAARKLDSVWPQQARDWDDAWTFHVILNFDGLVMDLDYHNSPRLEEVNLYFARMFPLVPADANEPAKNQNLLVKRMSAGPFIREYILKYSQYPLTLLNLKNDALFPPELVADVLAKSKPGLCPI